MLAELGISVVIAVHLVAVNLGSAAPFVCIWLHGRGIQRDDATAFRLGKQLALLSVAATTLGIVLGGLSLAFLWNSPNHLLPQTLRQFPTARYVTAGGELLFYYLCMAAYILLWDRMKGRRFAHATLAVLAATDMWYHFPPLFTVLAVIPSRASLAGITIDRPAFRALMLDPQVVSHVLHTWLASLAVAGIATSTMATFSNAARTHLEALKRIAVGGGRLAFVATLLQIGAGTWLLINLPKSEQHALLGGDGFGSVCFAGGLIVSLVLMHHLMSLAIGDASPTNVLRAVIFLCVVVLLMTCALRRARQVTSRDLATAPYETGDGEPTQTRINPREPPIRATYRVTQLCHLAGVTPFDSCL